MSRLGKRPQGEGFCTLKGFSMKVPASLLFESNAEGVAVEFTTGGRLANNWTKTCDKQNFYLPRNFHFGTSRRSRDEAFGGHCHLHRYRCHAGQLADLHLIGRADFVNCLHAGQSPALREKLWGFWCDGIPFAAICIEVVSAPKIHVIRCAV